MWTCMVSQSMVKGDNFLVLFKVNELGTFIKELLECGHG